MASNCLSILWLDFNRNFDFNTSFIFEVHTITWSTMKAGYSGCTQHFIVTMVSRQMSTWKSNLILSRNSGFRLLNSKKNRISSKCLSEYIEQLKIVDWQRDHLSSLLESKHYYFNSNRMNFIDHWYALQWYEIKSFFFQDQIWFCSKLLIFFLLIRPTSDTVFF